MRYVKTIILSLLVIASLNTASGAHEWYPYDCCSDKDCHEIPCESITERGKNLVYNNFSFYDKMIRPSKDGQCHVCISNKNNTEGYAPVPHCIFTQQGS